MNIKIGKTQVFTHWDDCWRFSFHRWQKPLTLLFRWDLVIGPVSIRRFV
jgi:hypothetical protein